MDRQFEVTATRLAQQCLLRSTRSASQVETRSRKRLDTGPWEGYKYKRGESPQGRPTYITTAPVSRQASGAFSFGRPSPYSSIHPLSLNRLAQHPPSFQDAVNHVFPLHEVQRRQYLVVIDQPIAPSFILCLTALQPFTSSATLWLRCRTLKTGLEREG